MSAALDALSFMPILSLLFLVAAGLRWTTRAPATLGLSGPPRAAWLAGASTLFVGWAAVIFVLAARGTFDAGRVRVPPMAWTLVLPLALVGPLVAGWPTLRRALAATEPWKLVGVQVYRLFGAVFLLEWARGRMPAAFALPAGLGDVAVGLSALFVARALRDRRPGSWAAARAWNLFGVLDLLVALTMGVLTAPGRFEHLGLGLPNAAIRQFPDVLIPTFLVPLSLILHGLALRRLGEPATSASARPR